MSKKWQSEKKREYFYKKAKKENYRSRASYKLKQLNRKFRLIRKGDRVLDLGASPGGWMQVAGEIVGDKGLVVGVDLEDIKPFEKDNMIALKGDMTGTGTLARIKETSPDFNAIISDASPNISGVWDIDHFNSIELTRKALEIAKTNLVESGNFLVKVFQGSLLKDFAEEVKREFEYSKVAKPPASRQKSSEVYIIGKGLLKTPVKRGDMFDVEILEEGREPREGVAYVDGFKIIVEGSKPGDKVRIRIKKVSSNHASAALVRPKPA